MEPPPPQGFVTRVPFLRNPLEVSTCNATQSSELDSQSCLLNLDSMAASGNHSFSRKLSYAWDVRTARIIHLSSYLDIKTSVPLACRPS